MNIHRNILLLVPLLALLVSCGSSDGYTPKPKGYMRVNLPEHKYWLVDTLRHPDTPYRIGDSILVLSHDKPYHLYPFIFEASQYAEVAEKDAPAGVTWIDVKYPQWNGFIFLTYKRLIKPGDLNAEVDTSYQLLSKHFGFSSGIDERQFVNEDAHVYATTYRLTGQNVASTFQFWATDSVRHFLRGSLYIDCVPNNDSLAPVLEYLQGDVEHIVESLRWR